MDKTSCFYEVKSTLYQPAELKVVSVYVRIIHGPKTETKIQPVAQSILNWTDI